MRTLVVALALATAAFADRPNFVFILADDLGWRDLGVYGSQYHETPHLDRLAAEGARFTDAYAAGNSCSPTRASILTGRYPARTHLTDWIPGRTPPGAKLSIPRWTNYLRHEETTIAEVLADAGYVTAEIGKWHLGKEGWWAEDHGFDVSIGGSHVGAHGSMFPPYWPADKAHRLGWRQFPEESRGEYLTDRLTREAVAFPRPPRPRALLSLPLSLRRAYSDSEPPGSRCKVSREEGGGTPEEPRVRGEGLDTSVGTVLTKLEELGIADRTVVFFFSDNGGLSRGNTLTSNEPLRGEKSTPWEGGVRVPLIVKWPGVTRPAAVIEEPVTSVDLFPTMLGMARLEVDDNIDGQSLVSILRGDADFERGPIYWHYPHYNAHTPVVTCTPYGAVREGRFKLVELYEDDRVELYDLRADIGETRNLATAMPERVDELRRKLRDWRESVGAQMPTSNPSADPAKYHEYKEKRLWRPVGPLRSADLVRRAVAA